MLRVQVPSSSLYSSKPKRETIHECNATAPLTKTRSPQQSLSFKRFFTCRETGGDGFVKDNRVSMAYMLRFLLEILVVVDVDVFICTVVG